MTVTSLAVKEGLAGFGIDLYSQWLIVLTMKRIYRWSLYLFKSALDSERHTL